MELKNPYFSIVIPTYNRASMLKDTIASVQGQSFENWECIVVDDGSTDQTKDILDEIIKTDHRIRYLFQENAERGAARNNGASQSKGKYLCFLDSDDHFLPEHLSVVYQEIQNKNEAVALFFTNALMKNEQGIVSDRFCPDLEQHQTLDYILNYTFNPARVAVHSDILKKEQFDPTIPGLEDLELWLRIALYFPIFQIKQRTILYNLHAETYTIGDLKRYEKELKNFTYIFKKPVFKGKLNQQSSNRLLSMCHYHLAIKSNVEGKTLALYQHGIQSFLLCPKGYNGSTNKPLAVMLLYGIPIFGSVFRALNSLLKK